MSTTVYSRIATHIKSIDTALSRLCELIPSLGLDSRKAILDVCQTATHAEEYEALDGALVTILEDRKVRPIVPGISVAELEDSLFQVSQSIVYRCLVSMLVRNEPLDRFSKADEAIVAGFEKEFGASQSERPEQTGISYQILDQDNFHPAQYSVYYPITPRFARFARNFANAFASRLDRLGVLFNRDSCPE
jgi:hypothetical protein